MSRDFALPDDTLATVGLYSDAALLGPDEQTRHDLEATATLVRPLTYRLDRPSSGDLDLLICFPFDLHRLSGRQAYHSVELKVGFRDERVKALLLDPASGAVVGPDEATVSARGRGGHTVEWLFQASHGPLRPDGHWSQVVVRAPADHEVVSGRISLSAELRRTVLGRITRIRPRTLESAEFALPVAEAWQAPGPVAAPGPGTLSLPGFTNGDEREPWVTRLLFAVDIEKYSRRDSVQTGLLQRDLWRVVQGACAYAELELSACGQQASGDGYLLVLPTEIDEPAVVRDLLDGLALGLDAVNTASGRPGDLGRTRLRAAVHQGLVRRGATGFAGREIIALCRILDSASLRQALAAARESDLAIALSDSLYRGFVRQGYPGLDADRFTRHLIVKADKDFETTAWIETRPRPGAPR